MPIAMTIIICTFLFDMASGGQISPLIASTRGLFDPQTGEMSQERNQESLDALNILGLDDIGNCPGEISIYVHGVWSSEEEAEEQVDRVNRSLRDSGHQVLLVGFSWDSDTEVSQEGWKLAKEIANTNGHKLAEFISSFKEICQQDSVRIIAHSLGARVTLAALQDLFENPALNNVRVTSVHLMGAAVDNEQISLDPEDCFQNIPPLPCSGQAIESQVEEFFNLYNPEDNILQTSYIWTDGDLALGHWGKENGTPEPGNYNQENVLLEIPPLRDADGNGQDDCFDDFIIFRGDNHCGYMGYRTNPWDNGAIDIVARDWRS
jgi:pimeloyl-ACP methyl ester carboxylesterase